MKVIAPGDVEIDLGITEITPTIGIDDFSRRETDDFGVTTVVPRAFRRRMAVKFALPTDDVDAVQRTLANLRATEAQWVASEDFAWLNFAGFYRDFSIDVAAGEKSFCTLTVEGLAENETVTDAGEDPAPSGTSSLLLIQPVTLTSAMLISSNVAETDWPEWSNVTVYADGAKVIKAATHRIYESLVATNVANDPAGLSGKWLDVGPTNRWAMFDEALGTATTRVGGVTVTLAPGAATALALLDVVGSTVRVQKGAYDQTKPVTPGAISFLDLPGGAGNVTVTIAGAGAVSVGTLIVGKLVALGITEESPTAAIADFSRKEVDDFGEATIVERAWAKRMTVGALISSTAVDIVANRLAAVRTKPSLWIAQAGTDALTIYGFFKDFGIEVGQNTSKLSLSVEGLSKAAPATDAFDGLSIVEKTIYRRSASAPATPTGGSFDFDTMTATAPVGWSTSVPAGTDPVYVSDAIASKEGPGGTAAFGAWSPPVIGFVNGADGAAGAPGSAGAAGSNNAVVYLYRRGATSPAVPTGTFTFTFSTGVLSGGTLNGWTQAIPAADGNPLWVIAAAASATTATDSIAAAEFSAPVLKDGAGLNSATVFLYQRAASAPSVPGATTTYTFATGVLAGTLGSWTQTVPAHNGNPLYVITATALAATATDTIATGEWSAVRVLAENGAAGTAGAPGAPGANGTTYFTWYAYADHPTGLFNFTTGDPGGRTHQGVAYNKTTATESTNPADYAWSPYIGPPNFGLAAFNANTVVAGNKIIKTSAFNGWDASIHSTESYKGGASISVVIDTAAKDWVFGLNTDPTTNASWETIDYAFNPQAGGNIEIIESGVGIIVVGTYAVGDVFTMTYNDKAVVYSVVGAGGGPAIILRTVAAPSGLSMFFDCSLYRPETHYGRLLAFTAAGTAGSDGATGAPGSNGISPVSITISPPTATVQLDKDGQPKSGQLPMDFVVNAMQGGNVISLTSLTINASSGGTFTENDAKVSLTALSDTDAVVQFTAVAGGQTIGNLVIPISTARDGAGGASATVQTAATTTIANQASYTEAGNRIAINVSSTGKLKFNLFGSIRPENIEAYVWQSKIQYSLTGGSSWVDVTGSAKDSSATLQLDVPPFTMRGGTLSSSGPVTLTGLTADAPALVRAVIQKKSGAPSAMTPISGTITLYAEQAV